MTEKLSADMAGLTHAAELLKAGDVVAFPTDTVYGLGADARSDDAVEAVFTAKGRPSFNPLIVHVDGLDMAQELALFTPAALAFAQDTWPEPVTLVLPLRADAGLSSLVTAGQDSVALRMPGHPIAQQLITAFGGPIAAPSANPSGRISPTNAEHVLSGLKGKIAAVIDGGPTPAGLESTILSFLGDPPSLLRAGTYLPKGFALAETLDNAPTVPGQLASHYAPSAPVRLNATKPKTGETHIGFGPIAGDISLSVSGNLAEAAAKLYATLHEMERVGATAIAIAPIPQTGLGIAINDRLRRAAAPRNA